MFLLVLLISLTAPSLVTSVSYRKWDSYPNEVTTEPPLPPCKHPKKYESNWILQFSDHFAVLDPSVWRLRYFLNVEHFDYGGPIYVIIGGPWQISPHFVCSGLVVDAAKGTRGAVFYLEHRFYGQSHPVKQKTKSDLSLLTRNQVIEDIRYFITYQQTHSLGMNNSQVILIGSHLGGSLAAWTQQKYPLLINGGVWATGAPFTSQQYLPGYLQSIERFVEDVEGPKCLHALDDNFRIIQEEMTGVTPAEYKEVFEMCPGFDFKKHQDQSTFLYRLFSTISQSLLLNRPKDISDLCYELLDPQYLDVVEAFAPYFLGHQRGKGRCIDYSFRHLINDTANRDGVIDLWAYQSCSEFGWFPGGPENHWLPATFFDSICYNAFSLLGEQREEAQEETQKLFEGIVADARNNIILSYGQLDPWAKAGIQEFPGKSKERQVIFVPGVSFRNTLMHSLARNDSQDVQKAKMLIINKLERWAEMSRETDSNAIDSGARDRLTVISGSGLCLLLPLGWCLLLFASGIY